MINPGDSLADLLQTSLYDGRLAVRAWRQVVGIRSHLPVLLSLSKLQVTQFTAYRATRRRFLSKAARRAGALPPRFVISSPELPFERRCRGAVHADAVVASRIDVI